MDAVVVVGVFGIARDQRNTVGRLREFMQCGVDPRTQATMEEQILGRITHKRELGEDDQVRLRGARHLRALLHATQVGSDVADAEVLLRESELEARGTHTRSRIPSATLAQLLFDRRTELRR